MERYSPLQLNEVIEDRNFHFLSTPIKNYGNLCLPGGNEIRRQKMEKLVGGVSMTRFQYTYVK